jgi:catechol 2,3-dioxygenase-like lactoylglutathione lyase family enzyme
MFKHAVRVLHVSSIADAEEFYCTQLGFRPTFKYGFDERESEPCYMGLVRERVRLHISSFIGDGVSGSVVFLVVDDVDVLHAELKTKNVTIALEPTDQSWGNREMYSKGEVC